MRQENLKAEEALKLLKEGNYRYVNNLVSLDSLINKFNKQVHVQGQKPHTIVLSCSDSRVPVEIIFDQGLGDIFVIRIAGNITAPSIIGSVEFASSVFGTQLVVVMGHSKCGAIATTIKTIQESLDAPSKNLEAIVDKIRPSIENLVKLEKNSQNQNELLEKCIRANVIASANQLLHGSKIIEDLVKQEKLKIICAEYLLESGKVDFFTDFL
jgi:carbonic anhydrase